MVIENCFFVYATKNIFIGGVAKSFTGNLGVGSGSAVVMTAGADLRYSVYVGNDNKYINGMGESRGIYILLYF